MSNVPVPHRCPRCRVELASPGCLAIHLRSHPECRAYASLARSLSRVGFGVCPRCRLALSSGARRRWSRDGFVHERCLTFAERLDLPALPVRIPPPEHHMIGAN